MSVLAEEQSRRRKEFSYAVVALPSFASATYPVLDLPPPVRLGPEALCPPLMAPCSKGQRRCALS